MTQQETTLARRERLAREIADATDGRRLYKMTAGDLAALTKQENRTEAAKNSLATCAGFPNTVLFVPAAAIRPDLATALEIDDNRHATGDQLGT